MPRARPPLRPSATNATSSSTSCRTPSPRRSGATDSSRSRPRSRSSPRRRSDRGPSVLVRHRELHRLLERAVEKGLDQVGQLSRVDNLLRRPELLDAPPPVIDERALLDLVPAVVLGRERRDGHGEERLALAVPTALEREAAHPRRDDWAELPGIEAEAGLLQHFPDGAVLDR